MHNIEPARSRFLGPEFSESFHKEHSAPLSGIPLLHKKRDKILKDLHQTVNLLQSLQMAASPEYERCHELRFAEGG